MELANPFYSGIRGSDPCQRCIEEARGVEAKTGSQAARKNATDIAP